MPRLLAIALAFGAAWGLPVGVEQSEELNTLSFLTKSAPTAAFELLYGLQLQVDSSEDIEKPVIHVNDHQLDVRLDGSAPIESAQIVPVISPVGTAHDVNISWTAGETLPFGSAIVGSWAPVIAFDATLAASSQYCTIRFLVAMQSTTRGTLLHVSLPFTSPEPCQPWWEDDNPLVESTVYYDESREAETLLNEGSYDLAADLESLRLLETEARGLQAQISAKKRTIAHNVGQRRDKLCLRHLLRECDGVTCAVKAIAQRLCAKVGIHIEPKLRSTFKRETMNRADTQNLIMLDDKFSFARIHDTDTDGLYPSPQAMNMPLMLTKNGSDEGFRPIDLVVSPNPIVQALQIIVGILGISTLIAIIRRKCMSLRGRAERAADLEERRNARAYRRAARRALMRRRWDDFVKSLNCFKSNPAHSTNDYEEKRALILQDAFLEQELDQAEKGEIMEAEIRELRCAQEIVASLVRSDHNRYDLITPICTHDPPPSLIPLPYTSGSRSRAASTYTLPSYTSEMLPDYSCSLSTTSGHTETGPTSLDSGEEGRPTPCVNSDGSRRTRFTPNSSVIGTSTRPSGETLRTRQSDET